MKEIGEDPRMLLPLSIVLIVGAVALSYIADKVWNFF